MVATVNESYRLDVNAQESGVGDEPDVLIYGWNVQETVVINKTTDAQGDVTTTNIEVTQYDDDGVTPTTTVRTPIKIRALKFGFFFREQDLVIAARASATFFLSTNTVLTESVQATVDAYSGITYSDIIPEIAVFPDEIGTPVDRVDRLYDRTHSRYSKAATPPQYDYLEIIASTDKQNYIYNYDINLQSASAPPLAEFDGQGRNFVRGAGTTAVWRAVNGKVKDVTVDFLDVSTGDETFTNVNVTDTLRFDVNQSFTWDGGQLNNVDLFGIATAVTLTLVNGASISGTIDPGITVVQSVPIFVKCIDEAGNPIQGVNIILGTGPGLSDVVDNVLTDVNGEINETYSGTTPDTAEGFAAKGTQAPTFKRAPLSGPIAAGTGYTQTITLISDD